MSKPALPELPLYGLPGASLDLGGASMPPLTPLASLNPNLAPDTLPLLVQMPNGQTKQVELRPGATVNDLRAQLDAPEDWVLNFNSEILDNTERLDRYHIPDAYDHAGGLLKMIDTSELPLGQKIEALEKACSVVRGISKGERDMDRIISDALNPSSAGDNVPEPAQHALRMLRSMRNKPGNIAASSSAAVNTDQTGGSASGASPSLRVNDLPGLSFSNLLPPGASGTIGLGQPFTPTQLIRKLGASAPDLFPPKAADKMISSLARPAEAAAQQAPRLGAAGRLAAQASRNAEKAATDARGGKVSDAAAGANLASGKQGDEGRPGGSGVDGGGGGADVGSGPVKRTGTWFEDVMKSLVPSEEKEPKGGGEGDDGHRKSEDDEDIGGSEDSADESAQTDGKHDEDTAEGGSKGYGTHCGAASSAVGSTTAGSTTANGAGGTGKSDTGPPARVPKKRGRKRKNPELSEEERKALRQAQNRESAKMSRQRRKTIAAEYEQRVSTLSTENESLRDTISALSDRLQFLQSLLTVSVTQRPPQGGAPTVPAVPSMAPQPVSVPVVAPVMPLPPVGGPVSMATMDPSTMAGTGAPSIAPAPQSQNQGYVPGLPRL